MLGNGLVRTLLSGQFLIGIPFVISSSGPGAYHKLPHSLPPSLLQCVDVNSLNMKFIAISALVACAAAYGPTPAPAGYGVTPVPPTPFALAAGKCMLAKFALAPHPGSPLAAALAGLQNQTAANAALLTAISVQAQAVVSGLQELVGNADPERIALVVKYLATHPTSNFFAIIKAPKCTTATEPDGCPPEYPQCIALTDALIGPGYCVASPPQ